MCVWISQCEYKPSKHEVVRLAETCTHLSSIWKTICFIGHSEFYNYAM